MSQLCCWNTPNQKGECTSILFLKPSLSCSRHPVLRISNWSLTSELLLNMALQQRAYAGSAGHLDASDLAAIAKLGQRLGDTVKGRAR